MTIKWSEVKKIKKTADWLLSWVYDGTDKKIYIGQNHIHIMDQIPDWMEKGMNNEIVCGWYVHNYDGVTTRIATDTVEQGLANKYHELANEAQKAAMKYWQDHNLEEDYDINNEEYCEYCHTYYDPEYESPHYEESCPDCGEYFCGGDGYEWNKHMDQPYCEECGEHVDDYSLENHQREYHFEPEEWMPKEESEITYQGQRYFVYDVNYEGMDLVPVMPGHTWPQYPYKGRIEVTWDEWKKDQKQQQGWIETHPEQTTLENPYPGWIEPKMIQGVPTTPPSYWKTPHGSVIHCVDLQDAQVFAKLSYDYMGVDDDVDWILPEEKQQNGDDISQNAITQPNETGLTDDQKRDEILKVMRPDEGPEQNFTPTEGEDSNIADIHQPDDPRMLEIARDWDSDEYRWSYDGTQLHMWRVFNRNSYGPSHYDMFGHDGYESHSQGRVYVSQGGKVGVLYWQITHPECERVLNEWCIKTFGKLPDYTYRAYGPYQGKPVSRWDFPIVEVGGLPIRQNERWWEQPGGYPGMKLQQPDYPSKKKKKSPLYSVPGPIDDQGQPVTPSKSKRRKRTRNRKYRNRSFRGR